MKNKVYILLDRSGSMSNMWEEALGGINAYVKKIKNAEVMLAAFDNIGYDVIRNTTTVKWKDISNEDVTPRGGTPLLDAAGRIMQNMMDSGSKRAILVVVTDGEENSSNKFRVNEIHEMTDQLTKKYDYDIVFLGANFKGIADVAKTNFGWQDNSRWIATSARGFDTAMNATATATTNYFTTGNKDTTFYDQSLKKEVEKE